MARNEAKPFLVAIAGGSASGKSTFARLLAESCQDLDLLLLAQDHYYKDCARLTAEEVSSYNFDHPDAIDFSLMYNQLDLLLKREAIERPTYDFVTHARLKQTQLVQPRDIILLEGLFVCYGERLRSLADVMIYIEASDDVRVFRRLRRDLSERGWTFEGASQQYLDFVKPMHDQFVDPTRHSADLIVNWNVRNDRSIEAVGALLRERSKK